MSDLQNNTAHKEKQVNADISHPSNDWYDQAFDLAEDSGVAYMSYFQDDYAINPNLINSAEAQLVAACGNTLVSDAALTLSSSNATGFTVDMDPITERNQMSASDSTLPRPREGEIMVGGVGKLVDLPEPPKQSSYISGSFSASRVADQASSLYIKQPLKKNIAAEQASSAYIPGPRPQVGAEQASSTYIKKPPKAEFQTGYTDEYLKVVKAREREAQERVDAAEAAAQINSAMAESANMQAIIEKSRQEREAELQADWHDSDEYAEQEAQRLASIAKEHDSRFEASQTGKSRDTAAGAHAEDVLESEELKTDLAGEDEVPLHSVNEMNNNAVKSLEELAQEYPDLNPEDLIKLRRSSNRCHLVSRVPIFDSHSNVCMYEIKFTSGKVFQINALKPQHVYHVLCGYFIRRGISCFVGRDKLAMVMMPITHNLLDMVERYAVSRLVLRISPQQEADETSLKMMNNLRRHGMRFAIDLMTLLKQDWSPAAACLEYVMIDLSTRISDQLRIYNRLKAKAPWIKCIGCNDINHEGYALLATHRIDMLNASFWNPELQFIQDIGSFAKFQSHMMRLIMELFKDEPNYAIFAKFLCTHEVLCRNVSVFLYRFRNIPTQQIKNINDLYHALLAHPGRSFSVIVGYTIMQAYVRNAVLYSQNVLQEYYVQGLIRGFFAEYLAGIFDDPFLNKYAFQAGMYSLLHQFMLRDELSVLTDESLDAITNRIYGESELMADIIDCVKAIESTSLTDIFQFIQKYQVPPVMVLVSYEKALMRTNELLLVLNLTVKKPRP